MKNVIPTITIQTNTPAKMLFWGLVSALAATVALYMYFVNATVVYIVMRDDVERRIGSVQSSLGELEARYASLQNSLSVARARSLSFEEPAERTFAARKRLVTTLVGE
ncbi:MAG: hypothetical protein HYS74_01615 [Parcubacteria group bacterium]|nr:hypothetical protein [Parcubacteria group bacterium]